MKKVSSVIVSFVCVVLMAGVVYADNTAETVDDRVIDLRERELGLEREKFEYEKAETKRAEYERRFSPLCDIKGNVPVFKIYASIGEFDRLNLRNDLSILYERGYKKVIVNISSGGGSAFAGLSMADVISEYRGKGMTIEMRADGIVASAAVPIYAVASERISSPSTLFMVHESALWKFSFGYSRETHTDISAQKDMMDKLQARYLTILSEHSDRDYDFWLALEGKTSWFTAKEALEWGLVDKIE
jgi:ATP-dependent Clp protease protease subunit